MSRSLAAATQTHVEGTHVHPVIMCRIDFTPTSIYVHTGLGTIGFESNSYLGVGTLGGLSGLAETENLVPSPITLSLSGIDSNIFGESLDASNYGDRVFLHIAYRNDDGTVIGTPWNFYKGRIEYSSANRGREGNIVSMVVQHVLAILSKKIATRYTDESQQKKFPGDLGFQFIEQNIGLQLQWGARDPGTITNFDSHDLENRDPGSTDD